MNDVGPPAFMYHEIVYRLCSHLPSYVYLCRPTHVCDGHASYTLLVLAEVLLMNNGPLSPSWCSCIYNHLCCILCCRNITLILTDSRGIPVRRMIGDPNIKLEATRGARLHDMISIATTMIARYNPSSCLIIAGVNDMTVLDRRTRKVSLLYYDPFEMANHIIRAINRARRRLIQLFEGVKFGFGGIIGLNLNHYNNIEGYSPYQWVIDGAVRQINAYIRLLNQQQNLYHPRLTSKVHSYYRGRPKNNYRLLRDGLHLGDTLVASWARSIERYHLVNTVGIHPFWSEHFDASTVPLSNI